MSKAVLVIDIPESCAKCYFHRCTYSLPLSIKRKGYICHYDKQRRVVDLDYGDNTYKPDWCPLVPMPEKRDYNSAMKESIKEECFDTEDLQDYAFLAGKVSGWNACAEALEMAVEVLEKQIPKNPIKTNIYEGERAEILKKRGAINPEVFKCPACKKIIDPGYSNSYCKKCGQRIDWEQ